jgi:hypothetical protein
MKKTCPICNEPLLTHYRATYVENVVGNLQVKCMYHKLSNTLQGCDWTGEAHRLLGHIERDCVFHQIKCPLHVQGLCVESCYGMILRSELTAHLNNVPFDSVCSLITNLTNTVDKQEDEIKALKLLNIPKITSNNVQDVHLHNRFHLNNLNHYNDSINAANAAQFINDLNNDEYY